MPFDPITGTFIRPAQIESFGVVQAPEGTMPVATSKDDILTFKTDGSIRIQGNAEDDSLLFGLNEIIVIAQEGASYTFPLNPKPLSKFTVGLMVGGPQAINCSINGLQQTLTAPKRFIYIEGWVEI
jgi:hypothetical protein